MAKQLPTPQSPLNRSKAVYRLHSSLVRRSLAVNATEEEKDAATKEIYYACLDCYEQGISRTQVHKIIKSVSAEFNVASPC